MPGMIKPVTPDAALVVDVTAANLAPPLTIEWHPSGDFHIHHL